jgi:hypothetical protein
MGEVRLSRAWECAGAQRISKLRFADSRAGSLGIRKSWVKNIAAVTFNLPFPP